MTRKGSGGRSGTLVVESLLTGSEGFICSGGRAREAEGERVIARDGKRRKKKRNFVQMPSYCIDDLNHLQLSRIRCHGARGRHLQMHKSEKSRM